MNCQQAQERILESLSEAGETVNTHDLTTHLAGCEACRLFSETQSILDTQLCAAMSAPPLSPNFRRSLAKKIRREPVSAWPAFLPDFAHLAGCLVATALCLWLLPFAPGLVILDGLAFTVAAWFAQSVLQSALETADDESGA
jgi:predicted anti-sigma-YlaC factor YlaD